MSDWRPIETAPRDETRIMLYVPMGPFGNDENEAHVLAFRGSVGKPDEGWYTWDGANLPVVSDDQPIAWMPLPSPPTTEDIR